MAKETNYQDVVARNVRRLRNLAPEGHRTIKLFAAWVGVGNGTIDRIEKAQETGHDPQLSSLIRIAGKFGLEPWHLLIDKVDPVNKPYIVTSKEMAWHLKVEELMEEKKAMERKAVNLSDTGSFTPPVPNKSAARKFRKKK